MAKKTQQSREIFIPRDLSWLDFNERVLDESLDANNPLLERIRFLAIFVNNLDEFLMVRVAGLKRLIDLEVNRKDRFGYYPRELMEMVKAKIDLLVGKLYDIYQDKILPELTAKGIHVRNFENLNREQKKFVKDYFETTLFPIITPMAIDPGHPFPILPSKTMAFAVHLDRKGAGHFAIVPVPQNVPRLVSLPAAKNDSSFILGEEIIRHFIKDLFRGYKIKGYALFRVFRDSELSADTEDTDDLLKAIEEEVKKRMRSQTVYLKLEKGCPQDICERLCEGLSFPVEDIKYIDKHFDLSFLFEMAQKAFTPELAFAAQDPVKIPYENIFDRIKEGDFMVHLPFHSFYPTVDLIAAASRDPQVLAIKMTLYRVNEDSLIVKALKEAARNKKQVTVLVEIKARFDEANNIRWVRELEEAGCHVIYGIPGLKVHSKMALIVRKEENRICRYVHLSTGNYNEKTARIYTDIGYFTANEDFAKDVSELFNVITGYAIPAPWRRVIAAPTDLRDYLCSLIDREVKLHQKNGNGLIVIKVNSLEDTQMIEKLYAASQSGVKIRLIVRGICCLVPGVKGISEHITVKSVVGRYLEHTRMFYFHNNGAFRVFLSSADLMTRNLDHRIELLFEVNKEDIKNHLKEILDIYGKDSLKSRMLLSNRKYVPDSKEREKINAQENLQALYKSR